MFSCIEGNFDLDICRGLHGLKDNGFASAPARFWDRGARCFVRRFILGLDEAAAFFLGSMIRDPKASGSGTGEIFTPCQDKGMPSRAARDYRSCRDERRSCRRGRLEVIGS